MYVLYPTYTVFSYITEPLHIQNCFDMNSSSESAHQFQSLPGKVCAWTRKTLGVSNMLVLQTIKVEETFYTVISTKTTSFKYQNDFVEKQLPSPLYIYMYLTQQCSKVFFWLSLRHVALCSPKHFLQHQYQLTKIVVAVYLHFVCKRQVVRNGCNSKEKV